MQQKLVIPKERKGYATRPYQRLHTLLQRNQAGCHTSQALLGGPAYYQVCAIRKLRKPVQPLLDGEHEHQHQRHREIYISATHLSVRYSKQ